MAYEQIWVLLVILALSLIGAGHLYRTRLRLQQVSRRRELIHEERMAALDRGIAFHEMPPDLIDEIPELTLVLEQQSVWVERSALAFGLLLTTAGAGWVIGLALVPATKQTLGLQEMAPLGVIPALVGIGLLVFRHLIRRENA